MFYRPTSEVLAAWSHTFGRTDVDGRTECGHDALTTGPYVMAGLGPATHVLLR